MKRLSAGLAVLGLTAFAAVAANAAGLYSYEGPYGPAPIWTGFYLGVNAGYGWGSSNASTTTEFAPTNYWFASSVPLVNGAGTGTVSADGFVGGGQAGYDWQFGHLVLGAEADFGSFNLNGSRTAGANYICCAGSFQMTQSVNADWLLTARARLGWAANRWLVYGTGGVAVTDLSHRSIFADTFGAAENVNDSAMKVGWAAGAGLEYAFSPNWSLKAEYLHLEFGSVSSISILGGAAASFPTRMFHSADLDTDIARAGINYHVGVTYEPLK